MKKLLRLCRPYRRRLALGVLMGLLGGFMEPMLMVCVKWAVDVAFPGATLVSIGSPMFSQESINDVPGLTLRLQAHTDAVSKYLYSRFTPLSQERINSYSTNNPVPQFLPETLVSELNLALLDPALYNEQRFAGVTLSDPAKRMLAQNPSDSSRPRLNRMLLESAYPAELSSMRLSYIEQHPWLQEKLSKLSKWMPARSNGPSSALTIRLAILSIPLMIALRGIVSYLNVYMLQWVGVRAIMDLRERLYRHLLNLPLGMLTKMSTGELMSRLMGDTAAVQSAISNSLLVIIKDPATLVFLFVALLYFQPMLTLLSMIIFPICLVPIIIYSRKVRASSREMQNQSAHMSRLIHESFTGNRIIKAYNLEDHVVGRFRQAAGEFITQVMRSTRAGEMPGPLIEFFGGLGVACLFYYILVLSHKRISAGDFLFFVGCVFSMYRPIKSLSRLYSQIEMANAASSRVFKLLETPSSLIEPADPLPLKAAGAEIKFDRVSFQYDPDHPNVLSEFTLTVKAGQMVALVGQTGSGKTTVTNLLLRFYDPQHGSVRIGGIDIRNVSSRDLRHQIAVVTQDTLLFDESIRHNIELGRPGASEEEIIAAAQHARAHEFIMEKPRGFETVIGEKGVLISGGQKQRLAIARAILKNAPILILDEATSALDTKVERAVQAALEELMEGRTTICIAHRLSTIQRADLIVVLEQGRIVEMGRHEELLRKNGVYQKLYEMQFQT